MEEEYRGAGRGRGGAQGEGAGSRHQECEFANYHTPNMSWIFFKRAQFLEASLERPEAGARRPLWRGRLVLILLLMGRQVFSTVFGKKVS